MFLGIFSSIIPYLIAAGFYLAWILFSLVQPLLVQKKACTEQVESGRILHIDNTTPGTNESPAYQFDDHDRDINLCAFFTVPLSENKFISEILLPGHHPPGINEPIKNSFILSGNFSRPPPSC